MPRLRLDQYLALLFLAGFFLFFPTVSTLSLIQATNPASPLEVEPQPPEIVSEVTVPVFVGDEASKQQLATVSAAAVYVMDRPSGSILFAKNANDQKYLASTAKMMTALVAYDIYDLDRVLTVREEAFTTGTTAHLQIGEQFTVRDLLYALLVSSGNDAAFVLANNHSLGYDGFIQAMNAKTKALHLTHTHFANPSGLDEPEQQSTARDLAILAHEVMKNEFLRQVVGTKQYTIADTTKNVPHLLWNTHQLLHSMEEVVGVKTGTTEFAGENLITEVDKDGRQVLIVVLGSQARYEETKQIIHWTFQNYEWQEVRSPQLHPAQQ